MRKRTEFFKITKDILVHNEFDKLKNVSHHGISRHNHSMRVAYYTYLVTKTLHLNYKEATRGALLHDFFTDEVKECNGLFRLRRHPNHAVDNAKEVFGISTLEEDIIKTHMFPVTFTPPKYIESWIVDIIDDISAIYEKSFSIKKELQTSMAVFGIILLKFMK